MSDLLRPAKPEDFDRIATLVDEYHAESGYAFGDAGPRAALYRLLHDPSVGRVWAILHEGACVGYVVLSFGYSLEYHGRDAFVDELFVQPAYRGRGAGTRVLEALLPACRALGIHALHLEVERDNETAQRLYRRLGFRGNDRQLLSMRLQALDAGSGDGEDREDGEEGEE